MTKKDLYKKLKRFCAEVDIVKKVDIWFDKNHNSMCPVNDPDLKEKWINEGRAEWYPKVLEYVVVSELRKYFPKDIINLAISSNQKGFDLTFNQDNIEIKGSYIAWPNGVQVIGSLEHKFASQFILFFDFPNKFGTVLRTETIFNKNGETKNDVFNIVNQGGGKSLVYKILNNEQKPNGKLRYQDKNTTGIINSLSEKLQMAFKKQLKIV